MRKLLGFLLMLSMVFMVSCSGGKQPKDTVVTDTVTVVTDTVVADTVAVDTAQVDSIVK